jgi:hypothetical protein
MSIEMGRKSAHPGVELFDYLGGNLDHHAAQVIEQHLAVCGDCASMVALVSRLRERSREEGAALSAHHPHTSELAAFFYGKSPRSRSGAVASHVALCQSCANELGLYARAEQAASHTDSSRAEAGRVPDAAWEMIRDWRESSFARPRPDRELASNQALAKLSQVLSRRKDELRSLASHALKRGETEPGAVSYEQDSQRAGLVPVIIVDRSAQFRGVEMFERTAGPHGASILKHPEKSHRFDNKQFHALLDFGEQSFIVVSDFVKRDKVRLQRVTRPDGRLRRADYFIVED